MSNFDTRVLKAIKDDNVIDLKRLINEDKIDIHVINSEERENYLFQSLEYNAIKCFELFLDSGVSTNVFNEWQQDIIMCSLAYNNVKFVEILLKRGAKLQDKKNGWSLLFGVTEDFDNEMTDLLLKYGADPKFKQCGVNFIEQAEESLQYSIERLEYSEIEYTERLKEMKKEFDNEVKLLEEIKDRKERHLEKTKRFIETYKHLTEEK